MHSLACGKPASSLGGAFYFVCLDLSFLLSGVRKENLDLCIWYVSMICNKIRSARRAMQTQYEQHKRNTESFPEILVAREKQALYFGRCLEREAP